MLAAYHNYNGQFADGNGNFWASLRILTQVGCGEKVFGVYSEFSDSNCLFFFVKNFSRSKSLLKFLSWNLIFSEFAYSIQA